MAIVLDGTNGIDTPDLASAGPITGTTGTFSGAVQASGVTTNLYPLVSGTAVASTSGTSIDFTGIPSWVKRITVMFQGVSTNGTSNRIVQIGTSGGVVTSGYLGATTLIGATVVTTSVTAGFGIYTNTAADTVSGQMVITNVTGNAWVASVVVKLSPTIMAIGGSDLTLGGTLDRIRITTVNGTDTFDAGSINILYE
jgi:hypothetical protein